MRRSRLHLLLLGIVAGAAGCGKPWPIFHETGGGSWAVIVPPGFGAEALLASARERCGDAPRCTISAYTDEKYLAPDMADEDRWRGAAFTYSRGPGGREHLLWDCSRYPQRPAGECRGEPSVHPGS